MIINNDKLTLCLREAVRQCFLFSNHLIITTRTHAGRSVCMQTYRFVFVYLFFLSSSSCLPWYFSSCLHLRLSLSSCFSLSLPVSAQTSPCEGGKFVSRLIYKSFCLLYCHYQSHCLCHCLKLHWIKNADFTLWRGSVCQSNYIVIFLSPCLLLS